LAMFANKFEITFIFSHKNMLFQKIVTKRNTFQKKKNTFFRKLLTTYYENILIKHVFIFSSVEVDLLLTKQIKNIKRGVATSTSSR
jgi:hypothetical protein